METVLMPMHVRPILLMGAVLLAAGATGARADPIPQNMLDNSDQSCMQSCTSGGHAQDKCTAYCTCSVDSIEEKFTAQELTAVNSASVAGKPLVDQPIPQGSKDKLIAIVNACGPKLK
jgi:hypothetical protein